MKKKLTLNRESIRSLQKDETQGVKGAWLCTLFCTDPNSGYVECLPGYTCRYPRCIPF